VPSANEPGGRTPHPFDVTTVETLVGLMAKHDLSEIDLHHADSRIRLRKGATGPIYQAMPAIGAGYAPAPAAAPQSAAASSSGGGPASDKRHHVITSPTPGTFYAKPSPEEPAYVKVGSKVKPDSVVCKIEAMKIFNDITADCTGTVVEILVENAQPVEYGQPLFRVETA
jgi:acetyl-CoA carboxylase biotin carboxyl carrier protein